MVIKLSIIHMNSSDGQKQDLHNPFILYFLFILVTTNLMTMARRHCGNISFILSILYLSFEVCWSSDFPLEYPNCDEPIQKIVWVNNGENVHVSVTLIDNKNCTEDTNYWWNKGGETFGMCSCADKKCSKRRDERFRVKMEFRRLRNGFWYYFEMNITTSIASDSGLYYLHSRIGE